MASGGQHRWQQWARHALRLQQLAPPEQTLALWKPPKPPEQTLALWKLSLAVARSGTVGSIDCLTLGLLASGVSTSS